MAPRSIGSDVPWRRVVLEGILVPRHWNAAGEVAALALASLDEREYAIEDSWREGGGLLQHLRKRVRLTGTVIGNRLVRITAASVLDPLDTSETSSARGDQQ